MDKVGLEGAKKHFGHTYIRWSSRVWGNKLIAEVEWLRELVGVQRELIELYGSGPRPNELLNFCEKEVELRAKIKELEGK